MADTQETKIRKGQAFNLAVADAIKNNQEESPKYIYKRFMYYYSLADVVQGSDHDLILQVINEPKFDKILETLKEVFSGDKK